MGKVARHILCASLIIALIGCTAASKEIGLKSGSERKDVFSEFVKEPIPSGMAELRIRTSIKTKPERQFLPGRRSGIPAPDYPFLINIDGQAATWRVGGQRERNGKTRSERGEGLRYTLEKKLTLSAGLHRIFFGLPEEDCFVQIDATLTEGELNFLEFVPLYGECWTRHQSFRHGISGFKILWNENHVPPQSGG